MTHGPTPTRTTTIPTTTPTMRVSPYATFAFMLVQLLVAETCASQPDPLCKTGIVHADTQVCCVKNCGRCGGASCQDLPGGRDNCCASEIMLEDHSCDVQGPPCMMEPPPPASVNPKRGFVADGAVSCDTPLLLNRSGWYYDYNKPNPYRKQGLSGNCAKANATDQHKFVPMDWCIDGMPTPIPSDVDQTYFMGFNEPNNLHNCNTNAETIATAWGQIMEKHADSILVSPATAGNGIQWYDEFFGNCTKLYGDKGCNITYIATHCYSCHPESTLAYLKSLYDRYHRKIWLTEFSCGDHADGKSTPEHVEFMLGVLPRLDAADFVDRYSWMSARDASGLRGLVETNATTGSTQLTVLGQIWNTH